jgi:muramidase (phage lysozyme)
LRLTKYQWAAIATGLLTPFLYFTIKAKLKMSIREKNLKAFLLMIRYAEGTSSQDGYKKLYGGSLFNDFSNHPNIAITKWGITSTAAGAYQILFKTWIEIQQRLKLTDFSPQSQDKAAVELIKRRKALDDVLAGRFAQALLKCRKEWASLPGAGYNQSEKSPIALAKVYKIAGGSIAA